MWYIQWIRALWKQVLCLTYILKLAQQWMAQKAVNGENKKTYL